MKSEIKEKIEFLENLTNGDEIYWTDPDEGKCSRVIVVREIQISEDGVACIYDVDGSYLECLVEELS